MHRLLRAIAALAIFMGISLTLAPPVEAGQSEACKRYQTLSREVPPYMDIDQGVTQMAWFHCTHGINAANAVALRDLPGGYSTRPGNPCGGIDYSSATPSFYQDQPADVRRAEAECIAQVVDYVTYFANRPQACYDAFKVEAGVVTPQVGQPSLADLHRECQAAIARHAADKPHTVRNFFIGLGIVVVIAIIIIAAINSPPSPPSRPRYDGYIRS